MDRFFRPGDEAVSDTVDRLLADGRVLLCGVVEAEVLQGLRRNERSEIADLLSALDYIETKRRDFAVAGEMLGELQRNGITIPLTDAIIGAICSRRGIALLTTDQHFDHLPEVQRVSAMAGTQDGE